MNWFDLADELNKYILRGDTERPMARVEEALKALPDSPFHVVLGLQFTNAPDEVATILDGFLRDAKGRHPVGAVYAETNGFDINPDEWHFNAFSYENYGGQSNFDWLSDFTDSSSDMVLTGMEPLQKVYEAWENREEFGEDDEGAEDDDGIMPLPLADTPFPDGGASFEDARDVCSLLVVIRFQDLMRRAVPLMRELQVPLLATGHEYDFIAEFQPR